MNYCPVCQAGRLQRRKLAYLQWYEDDLLVVNRMPALVCDICGEHTYEYEAVEHLQQLLWSYPPKARKSAASRKV
jgi:YgiT-type zinc finger domain-containing protein